jgi:hypothetical protein
VRALIPAVIVLILVLGGLLAYRMSIRSRDRTHRLRLTETRADLAEEAIARIRNELSLADEAGMHDPFIIRNIITEYDGQRKQALKELTR